MSYRKEVCWNLPAPLDKSLFIVRMAEELRSVGLQRVYILGDKITFGNGTPQYFSRWNTLTAIDEGEVEVRLQGDKLVISCDLSFKGIVIAASLGIPVLVGLFVLVTGSFSLLGAAALIVIGWLVVAGVNYWLAVSNFKLFIKGALKDVQAAANLGDSV